MLPDPDARLINLPHMRAFLGFTLQVGGAGERGDDHRVHAAAPAGDGRAVGGGAAAGLVGRRPGLRGGLLRLRGRRRRVQARRGQRGGGRERAGGQALGPEVRLRAGHGRQHRAHRELRARVVAFRCITIDQSISLSHACLVYYTSTRVPKKINRCAGHVVVGGKDRGRCKWNRGAVNTKSAISSLFPLICTINE